MQIVNKPYLQTVDADIGTGVRETYPSGASSIVPYLRYAYSNTGGAITPTGYVLGAFQIKAQYLFRGRRGQFLSTDVEYNMCTRAR
jgi:hypothetical protein